jgi:hypothetical protein
MTLYPGNQLFKWSSKYEEKKVLFKYESEWRDYRWRRYFAGVYLHGGTGMKDILLLIGFLVFWIVLQKYILPRFGVPT